MNIPPSGAYKLINVGVTEPAIEGSKEPHSDYVVMVGVGNMRWGVTDLHNGKYTIQSNDGKYSFAIPKEDEIVHLGTTKYEWIIGVLKEDVIQKRYTCRISTIDSDGETLYWRAKLFEGKFAGIVYLSKETDENTEWIFDGHVGL